MNRELTLGKSAIIAITNEAKKSAALIEFEASRVNRGSYLPALSDAIQREQLDVAAEIIASGADVDEYAKWPAPERGMAPIHFANTPGAVELLANAKANINAAYKAVDHAWGMRGETALHTAVLGGKETDLRLAQALIKAGADKTIPFAGEYKYEKYSNLGEDGRHVRGNLSIGDRINTMQQLYAQPDVAAIAIKRETVPGSPEPFGARFARLLAAEASPRRAEVKPTSFAKATRRPRP